MLCKSEKSKDEILEGALLEGGKHAPPENDARIAQWVYIGNISTREEKPES